MDVSAIQSSLTAAGQAEPTTEQAAQRRELLQASKTINQSGVLGEQNELVFVIDRITQRAIMRVIDRETQEVVMQLPPEYVLHLAEELSSVGRQDFFRQMRTNAYQNHANFRQADAPLAEAEQLLSTLLEAWQQSATPKRPHPLQDQHGCFNCFASSGGL